MLAAEGMVVSTCMSNQHGRNTRMSVVEAVVGKNEGSGPILVMQ